MAQRIKSDPAGVKEQLTQSIAAATALGPAWPSHAPTIAEMTTARDNINLSIIDTDLQQDQWKVAAQLKRARTLTGRNIVLELDDVTTALYTKFGAEKNNFGIPPEGAPDEDLHKLIEIAFTDGPNPGSLKADWEHIEGASYEIQWSNTANFAVVTGSATSASASDYIISGLVPGTQYWMRVRPVRGGETAEWSDPATRFAPL